MDGDGLGDGIHPLMWRRGKARERAFRVSLLPRFIRRFDCGVAVGGSCSWNIGVKFGVVAYVNEFLAGDATMREIPTVEVAVGVGFGCSGDGWWSEGRRGVGVVSTVPVLRVVFGILSSTRRCSRKRGQRHGIFVVGAFGALAAPFALLAFVLSFAFPFVLAFPELKGIATAGL